VNHSYLLASRGVLVALLLTILSAQPTRAPATVADSCDEGPHVDFLNYSSKSGTLVIDGGGSCSANPDHSCCARATKGLQNAHVGGEKTTACVDQRGWSQCRLTDSGLSCIEKCDSIAKSESSPQEDDAVKHLTLGIALYDKGELDKAIVEFRTAIRQKPNYPVAHMELGNALDDKGDHDGAIVEYRTAISQQSNFATAHFNLGLALKAKGDLDGAIAEFRTAITQQPNYPEAQSELSKALEAKRKTRV
jgi:tetratricopeptide (TPR) repeat protein